MRETALTTILFGKHFVPLLRVSCLVVLALGASHRLSAAQATYNFSGQILANNSTYLNPDFAPFAQAVFINGSATVQTGLSDLDADSPNHSYFNGAFISFNIALDGIGTWSSTSTGRYEIWNGEPNVYPFDNAFSIVSGGGVSSGPAMGGNYFSDLQLAFGSSSPGMLYSDSPPATLQNWEHAYLYLNYYSGGETPLPTTVRFEFSPVSVPEPTTLSLLGLGAATAFWLGSKSRRR